MKPLFTAFALLFLLVTAACTPGQEQQDADTTAEKTAIRVMLYSWIPDALGDEFKTLSHYIDSTFEAQHPSIDLTLSWSPNNNVYDSASLKTWLGSNADTAYHLLEVDALTLGWLAGAQLVAPWEGVATETLFPAGVKAGHYQGQQYGIPHWLCGFFTVTRDSAVANAGSLDELVAALQGANPALQNLGMKFDGSWTTPSYYFDSYFDTYGYDSTLDSTAFLDLDQTVLNNLDAFVGECGWDGANACLSGDFSESQGLKAFAADSLDAIISFSEGLFTVLQNQPVAPERIKIQPAPLGAAPTPTLFADVFVKNSTCSPEEAEALKAFVAFMEQKGTYQDIIDSRFTTKELARVYLLPAQSTVITEAYPQDLYYSQLRETLETANPFPNHGFMEYRKTMEAKILEALKQ